MIDDIDTHETIVEMLPNVELICVLAACLLKNGVMPKSKIWKTG